VSGDRIAPFASPPGAGAPEGLKPAPSPPRPSAAAPGPAAAPSPVATDPNLEHAKRAKARAGNTALALTAQDAMEPHPPTARTAVSRRGHTFKHKPAAELFGFRKRDSNAEARLQAAIVQYIRDAAPQCLVFHVHNGGLRSKSELSRMRWQGVVAGIPDLVLVAPGGNTHFIEVKTPTGRLSPDQIAIHDHLVALGTPPAIARSIDDVRRAFAAWGLATREARQ
jgi:VRR-NUC domain